MKGFGHTFRNVAAVHAAVILLILVVPWVRARFETEAVVMPVAFVVEAAPLAVPETRAVVADPAPPVPEPEPAPPPEPAPAPQPAPPRTRPRPPVRTDAQWVRRPATVKPPSQEELERLLMQGAPSVPRGPAPDETARNLAGVRAALYRAWVQPTREEVGDSSVEAVITLAGGGRVTGRRLVRPSGNPAMDASVLAALNAVTMIPGLSERFIATHKEVTVAFRLE